MIIINADDWGRSQTETDIPLECYRQGRITSITAMVFMGDSRRAAEIALDEKIPTGLHLNFIEPFSGPVSCSGVAERQRTIIGFLNGRRVNQLLYNPRLRQAFEYVFRAQLDEFWRLYGQPPTHFDGHKHMHLCANMLFSSPIPRGERVRRSFCFERGEKGLVNRTYRTLVNFRLAMRYRLTDYFFALSQHLSAERFSRVCRLASTATVELMTHPAAASEEAFIKHCDYEKKLEGLAKGTYLEL
jgi:predicted glycoside hydrolase/deacetylase ChbG (UPF0249 family)